MTPTVPLRKALTDRGLLGRALAGDSWIAWRTLLIAAMGEALTDDEHSIFTKLTGRAHEPLHRIEELVAVVGRRGGKSRAMATLATYIGGLCKHPLVLGETGVLLVIAPDQRQASIVLDYCAATFEGSPILKQLIDRRTPDSLELGNGISIEVRAASFRRLRGPTYIAIIADEAAFWLTDDSANPDVEILNAVRPGLATTGGPLIIASSPYARRGVLFETHRQHFGPDGDPLILVAQGASRDFNPSLAQSVVDRALERDQLSASAEFLGQFRSDLEAFVSLEAINACIKPNIRERPPQPYIIYKAFVDPSGGRSDSFSLAVGHYESGRQVVVIDCLREIKPPFSPEATVQEFSNVLKTYGISTVQGDKYAGEWPVEQFSKFGIRYEPSAKPKSELYGALLPLINSLRVELLHDPKLVAQLCGLERRTARGGKDSIDHAPGAHDDVCNVVAGVSAMCVAGGNYNLNALAGIDDDPREAFKQFERMQLAAHIARYS